MEYFVCLVCNHVAFDHAPVDCPVCGSAIENYENVPKLLRRPADRENLTPEEEVHVPVLTATTDCHVHPDSGCIHVEVKVGRKEHVSEAEHYVDFIDAYLDKRFIGRIQLTPRSLAPVGCFHVRKDTGSLRVVSRCNKHGFWTSRIKLEDVILKS